MSRCKMEHSFQRTILVAGGLALAACLAYRLATPAAAAGGGSAAEAEKGSAEEAASEAPPAKPYTLIDGNATRKSKAQGDQCRAPGGTTFLCLTTVSVLLAHCTLCPLSRCQCATSIAGSSLAHLRMYLSISLSLTHTHKHTCARTH